MMYAIHIHFNFSKRIWGETSETILILQITRTQLNLHSCEKTTSRKESLMSQLFLLYSNEIKWRAKGDSWEKELNLMCFLALEDILTSHTALSLVKKLTSATKSQYISQYELCMITADSFWYTSLGFLGETSKTKLILQNNRELNWISFEKPLGSNMKENINEINLMSQLFLQDSNGIRWRAKGVSCFSHSFKNLMSHTMLNPVKKSVSATKSQYVSQYEPCMITADSFLSIFTWIFRRNIWDRATESNLRNKI